MIHGLVQEVIDRPAGSSLLADIAIGATSLSVVDAFPFSEDGGELVLNGATLAYTAIDLDADTITLAAPAPSAAVAGDSVDLSPAAPLRRALVVVGAGDAADVRVPQALVPLLAIGIREDDARESVWVDDSSGDWVISDIVGREAVVRGETVDVSTLDPVENISPDYTYPNDITMTQVKGGFIASVYQTEDVGTGIMQMGYNGLQSLRSDGAARLDLPNSDDRGIILDAESASVRNLTSLDGFAMRGGSNEIAKDGDLIMSRGTTQPFAPPSVSIGWDSINVADALGISRYWYGLAWSSGTSAWYVADLFGVPLGSLQQFNPTTGASVGSSFPIGVDPLGGVTLHGGLLYVLGLRVTGPFGEIRKWWVEVYNTSGVKQSEWLWADGADVKANPAIGTNGTNLTISLIRSDFKLVIQERTTVGGWPNTIVTDYTAGAYHETAAILYGSFDFGANRYVWMPRGSGSVARVFNTSGVEQTAERFPVAEGARAAGAAWDGTNLRSLGQGSAKLHTYTDIRDTATLWWVGNTWRRADATGPDFAQYETILGVVRSFTMTRRANVTVGTVEIPVGAGGADAPDSMTLYFGKGASKPTNANFFRRATPALGVTAAQFTTMDFTGGNPPTTGNFPNANPARLRSDDPTLLTIDGNGHITAPKKMQCGSVTVAVPSGVDNAFVDVTFPVAFDSTPYVTATAENSNFNTAARLRTTTTFRLDVNHIDGTATPAASVVVSWIAMVP